MPIRVICPFCARVGKAPDNALGRKARCPECQNSYVLTGELIPPEADAEPNPKPTARDDQDAYGIEPAAATLPGRTAARPPIAAPAPAAASTPRPRPKPKPIANPEPRDKSTILIPALAAGGAGLVLLAVLGAWGAGLFGRRAPQGNPPLAELVAEIPLARATASKPAGAETETEAKGDTATVSVAALLALDDDAAPAPASSAPLGTIVERAVESDVAAKARGGAAAVAAVAASDPTGNKPLTTAEIVAESEPSVALIKGKGSTGSGFLIGPRLVATNAHVIDDEFASNIEVQFVSADESHREPIHAELLYEDTERDLAFLAVATDLKPLRIAKTYQFRKGEDITIIGNPGMGDGQVLENAISRGVMSTKARIDEKNFYQLNIAINPGNSGGPVFDGAGRVIGVATLKSAKQEATGFSIPIEDLQAALAKVGAQSAAEAEAYRSKHRTRVAVQAMGGAGAIMCLLIDLRKADAQVKNPAIKELLEKIEPVDDAIEKELVPILAVEGPLIRKDQALAGPVRNMVGEMSENFAKLRSATANRKPIDDRQLRILKQNHRRLITGLASALKLEIPKDLMVAFDDHTPTQPPTLTMIPQNMGSIGSRSRPPSGINRSPSIRDRMQQRRAGGR